MADKLSTNGTQRDAHTSSDDDAHTSPHDAHSRQQDVTHRAQRTGWIFVLLASIVEVFWVLGLRFSETVWHWLGTAVMIVFSFYFIIKACESLPSGTVYAVFTGAGAAVIVLLDFTLFGADFSIVKLLFIALIIIGVIGLKISTDQEQTKDHRPNGVVTER